MRTGEPSSTLSRWVSCGDVRLTINVAGKGAPLVLVHGWAMDHRIFHHQVGPLARHFEVVTYDRRGFGASSGRPDLNRELDDLATIAHELFGPERFHLLGLSQGGRIALRFAATRPALLRSLILQGAPLDGEDPDTPDEERIPLEEYAALARSGRLEELRHRWLHHPMMRLGEDHEEAERLLYDMIADYTGTDLLSDKPDHVTGTDVLSTLADLELPVLVLTGRRETESRRRTARRLVATLRNAREIVFADSGHLCNLSEPQAYNAAVAEFCRRLDGP